MKSNIFVLLMVCACFIYGQNPAISDYKYAIKVYNTSSFNAKSNPFVGTLPTGKILSPSIVLMWQGKKRISQEVELGDFSWQKVFWVDGNGNPIKGQYQNWVDVALRYECLYKIGNPNWRFSPIISAGINPYIKSVSTNPETSLVYPSSRLTVGARVNIIPRLNIRLTNRWFLDINTPINLFGQSIQRNVVENPSLPLNQQRNTYFDFAPFSGISDISVRVGVGFRL